ncbi:MAG: Hsp33 family molecular chaperone HslO [Eubacteriales bacterium]
MDKLYKYLYNEEVKIHVLVLEECVEQAVRTHGLTVNSHVARIAAAECLAGILGAELKQTDASVYVSMKYASHRAAYNAMAYGDGRICAARTEYTPSSDTVDDKVVLETATRVGTSDYSSVVCGKGTSGAIKAYLENSMQRVMKYKTFRDGNTFYAVFAEPLPGSAALKTAWKAMREPLFINADIKKLAQLPKFRLLEIDDVKYGCNCSKRSIKRALISVGDTDPDAHGGTIETVCNFCGKKYIFTAEDFED